MDSLELLRRLVAARPDDPLWGVLFRRCRGLLRVVVSSRIAGRRRLDASALDDLSQDVMERLVSDRRRVIRRFAGTHEDTFEAYIRRIAENILRDQARRDAHRRSLEWSFPADEPWQLEAALAESPFDGAGDDPESRVVMREIEENVDAVLRRISPDHRQQALNKRLFELYFRDRYSIPQIARLWAVPLSASSMARRVTLIRKALWTSFAPAYRLTGARFRAGRRRRRKPGITR